MGVRINIDPDLYRQRVPVTLNKVRYTFSFFYVRRAGGWFFHLDLPDGTRVVSGVRIIFGVSLLKPYQSRANVPPGLLHVLGPPVPPRDPTRDEMGTLFHLYYWETN